MCMTGDIESGKKAYMEWCYAPPLLSQNGLICCCHRTAYSYGKQDYGRYITNDYCVHISQMTTVQSTTDSDTMIHFLLGCGL